ncbi:MAG: N-6 DNA methylase [Candidatus Cloacimonetes bacterium]|nr:N-6 DNA methylase [Candidatus Cloacimonadota bacterium]
MPFLDNILRNALERAIKEARDIAEAGATAALQQLGVSEASAPPYLNDAQKDLRRRLRTHARQLGDQKNSNGTQATGILTEEIAYEHWHRMLFARFLAENDLLMDDDPDSPVSLSLEDCEALAHEKECSSAWDLAARYASNMLPQIFRIASPVFELQFPPEHQLALENILAALPAEIFGASDALGWVYQFWQAKKKDAVNASEVKIAARELPAVTQLFTEAYMVQFLLDNSLGAWWAARRLSAEDLENASSEAELRAKAALPGMPLTYLRFVQEAEGWRPAAGAFEHWATEPKALKILDPCCGSGHFLVATLNMLVPLLVEKEALELPAAIDWALNKQIFGLELDPRCVEIAVFALALSAWSHPGATGYRPLPQMNIACCGLSVGSAKEEWTALANGDPALRQALTWLHDFYQNAPLLGSLLNPKADQFGEYIKRQFPEYAFDQLLSKVRPPAQIEAGLAAKGLLDATLILSNEYDLVITNVPYLARGKQDKKLQDYCEWHFPAAKNDLATVFLDRCLQLCHEGGTASIVLPQNWLFLTSYKKFREKLLKGDTWQMIARLGEGGFESSAAAGAFAVLIIISKGQLDKTMDIFDEEEFTNTLSGLDVSEIRSAQEKGENLIDAETKVVSQAGQLKNPDAVITLQKSDDSQSLSTFVKSYQGIKTGDDPRFKKYHWELNRFIDKRLASGGKGSSALGHLYCLDWTSEGKDFARLQGLAANQYNGISITNVRNIEAYRYYGETYTSEITVMIPKKQKDLLSVFTYIDSIHFERNVRILDQNLAISTSVVVKVPFDLEHWQKIADEKYPHGLPEPYSDDPPQWIFHGHPCGSVIWSEESKKLERGALRTDNTVLQVALARLLGYQWPAESDAKMELSEQSRYWVEQSRELYPFADDDGIVCISPVRAEESAMDRLITLLAAAYGNKWSPSILAELLTAAEHSGKSLESWLRDKFFAQHCKLFMHRPFIWQVWDGLQDGFSALINYHKFDNRKLQSLIYSYLGDWITRQKHDLESGIDGASEKLAAAEALQKKLILILEGDAPYDIFVRWKPLDKQAIGWNPDLNDGVRMNIRPFVKAEVLRYYKKPTLNINWDKDRGKDVPSAPWYHLDKGNRINDRHLTLKEKKASRS